MSKDDLPKSKIAEKEEKVLEFWQRNKIFEKTLEKESPKGDYVFYDGPPFATGLPHYGHILAGTIKDIIPRYYTMNGFNVKRRWGWDCHGLPIENQIQKDFDLKTKKDIEEFGIKKFNQAAKDSVFKGLDEWKKTIPRTGRFVDFDNRYTTMDSTFSESVWWGFKTLYEKGLVYEGFKIMQVSPLLETPLSNFEVNQGYKEIVDISATVKFELVNEPKTFILAWTTTPWTLPANTALAVNKELDYIKAKIEDEFFIVAKDLSEKVFADKEFEILETFKGKDLLGKRYHPVFDYYFNDKSLENYSNGWQVYHGDFVTVEDGTGVVHIAPAFGDDDLKLAEKNKIPLVQHVKIDGTIKDEALDFAGRQAKPKDNHQETDIEVIKKLAHRGLLFSKQKYTHSYPHCWRTDAPLLNYAMSSWFIKVSEIKDKVYSLNEKVNWVPESIGKSRFGNWLKDAKDWSVSRSRFWGTPIPIWKSEDGKNFDIIGSLEELREKTRGNNNYYLMRHGEADSNVNGFVSSTNNVISSLTEAGKEQIQKTVKDLKKRKITKIIVSPLNRTMETADMLAKELDIDSKDIIVDERIKEVQVGDFDGRPNLEYRSYFKSVFEKFEKPSPGGENLIDMKKRLGDFIYDIDKKYNNENILIITHEYCVWLLDALNDGVDNIVAAKRKETDGPYIGTGLFKDYKFSRIPHDDNYDLDFHRPYIDDITYKKDGITYRRIEDVFDTWIDSGSMPFASNHYPFNEKDFNPKKEVNFPADFIAEGLDQTRGWFYTLLVLSVGLFKKAPYKNVVVNGLVLAEDGRKMSKSLKNYPDVWEILNKYGADAMRYYMIASPIVRAEDLRFSEKGVDEVMKKVLMRLDNVYSFYELNTDGHFESNDKSSNILDQFILSRLSVLEEEVRTNLEKYELDKAIRPVNDFVDDLSTWYLRRSRDRFKGEGEDVLQVKATTKYVLENLSLIIAPFIPFAAEDLYQKINNLNYKSGFNSVHLQSWPKLKKPDNEVISLMNKARDLVSEVLELRAKEQIKVRQPLQSVTLSNEDIVKNDELSSIIKDEVNVKELIFEKDSQIKLDTNLTPELEKEGAIRDLIRSIQQARKNLDLIASDSILLELNKSIQDLVEEFKSEITKVAGVKEFKFTDSVNGEEIEILGNKVFISIKKI